MLQGQRKLVYWLLLGSILVYPLNYRINELSAVDYLTILFMFLLSLPYMKVKVNNLYISLFFFFILALSTMVGVLVHCNVNSIQYLGFIYKYMYPFLLILIVYNLSCSEKELQRIYNYLLFSYVVLVLWVYIYMFLLSQGLLQGSLRPSFPFSNEYFTSDAHLYSSSLSLGLIFFTLTFSMKAYNKILFLLFLIISFVVIMLTGSRSGIVMLALALVIYVSYTRKFFLLLTFSIFGIFIVLFLYYLVEFEQYNFLIERAFNFNLNEDESSMLRIKHLYDGISDASFSGYFIGAGILNSSMLWFDSLVGILMSHGGILGFLSFVLLLYFFRRNTDHYILKEQVFIGQIFSLLIIVYFFSNLITEFFLITRSVFPFLMYLAYLHLLTKSKLRSVQ